MRNHREVSARESDYTAIKSTAPRGQLALLALGRQELHFLSTGQLQVNIGNVIQFPAPQWATEQDQALAPIN